MKYYQPIQFSVILAGAAFAIPSSSPPTKAITLSNGDTTVGAEVNALDTRDIFARADVDCKGSSLCSNSQSFKDSCARARGKIEDTTYTSGGAKSGVCDGHCGLFVQGSGCSTNGAGLANGYDLIRAGGCQACGSLHTGGGCLITMNYVTGC
ncbi:hypothetical protein NUW58_g218 [Xylaria curta]|uniref:Uncharacterized protein n=1 Tax=Xylaria curta TaxID=42375 RepID=A0ACC1PT03_9PEZI|nr:hypothetical protein NUW58_g218 [Xylaria curta]